MENITAKCPNIFLQSVIIISLFSMGLAIECFQCNSAEHSDCMDLKVNDTKSQHYRKCDGNYHGHEPFCRISATEVYAQANSLRISRSCGWIRDPKKRTASCLKADTDFIKKRYCECFTDACNVSDRELAPFLLVLVTTTVSSVFRQLHVI